MTATATTTEGTMGFKKEPFKPLEKGDYLIRMNRVTEAKTKTGLTMLKVSYQVIKKVGDTAENESKSKGRLIFENLVLGHSNPKVNEINNKRADSFLKAVGVNGGLNEVGGDIGRIADYLETPFIAELGIEEDKGFGAKNNIRKYKKR